MKVKLYSRSIKLAAGLAILSTMSISRASASLVVDGVNNETSQTFYTVSSTDLIEGLQGGGPSNSNFATDGSAGGSFEGYMGQDGTPYSVTFALNTTINTAGYDITTINTYTGWSSYRVNQYYDIYYTTVDNASWTLLTSVTYQPYDFPNGAPGNVSTWVNVTDTTGVLASGVNSLRFDMKVQTVGDAPNLGASYREIDVFGVASVPEPGTVALLAIGGLALVMLRRRGRLV